MAYYSVLAVAPTDEDRSPDYIGPTNRPVARYGGRYLARTSSHQQLEGTKEDAMLRIVIEWPWKEAAANLVNDPD